MGAIVDDLSGLEIPGGSDPVRHIDRPVPPWEDSPITMCGRLHTDVATVVTRGAAVRLAKRIGIQRAGLFLCMQCLDRARYRGKGWEADPVDATSWWLDRHRMRQTAQAEHMAVTLHALGQLVERHREEFEALRSPDITRLDTVRRAKRSSRR